MLFDYLADKPWLFGWILLCGTIVTLAIAYKACQILWEILKGLVMAIDFQLFKLKVAKHRERPFKFRISWFLNSWLHFMGWGDNQSLTTVDGDQYQGFGRWIVRGKFQTVRPAVEIDPEDFEDAQDDLDDDDEVPETSDQKRP